nr:hypothetical protein [Babesia bovis]
MFTTGRRSLYFLASASCIATFYNSALTPVVAQGWLNMFTHGACPYRGNGCAQAGPHDNKHVHLGSFRDDKSGGSLEITLNKSELTSDAIYNLTVESQMSTGYLWIPMGIYSSSEHAAIVGKQESFYADLLTKDYMKDAMSKGKQAHDITITPFKAQSGGAGVEKGPSGCPVGAAEISMCTLTVHQSIGEGVYHVHFGYVSPFRGPNAACTKELVIRIVA